MTYILAAWFYLGMGKISIIQIVKETSGLSVLMLGIAFFYLVLDAIKSMDIKHNEASEDKKEDYDIAGMLIRILIGSFGASTIPTGIALFLCAITSNMSYIGEHMSGVEIYIAFAGITLMSIAVLSISDEKKKVKEEIEKTNSSEKYYHEVIEQDFQK
ncbi:hypothetical protein QUF50_05035 [Thiotrichales bacterium HSG1]|nr:hypothetical protein [Thiotrichales bacterium HSG1]